MEHKTKTYANGEEYTLLPPNIYNKILFFRAMKYFFVPLFWITVVVGVPSGLLFLGEYLHNNHMFLFKLYGGFFITSPIWFFCIMIGKEMAEKSMYRDKIEKDR